MYSQFMMRGQENIKLPNSNVVFIQHVHKIPPEFQVKAIIKKKHAPRRGYIACLRYCSQTRCQDLRYWKSTHC